MNKRDFLKASGAIIAGGMWTTAPADSTVPRTNWAGNYQYRAPHLYTPSTLEEVQKIVAGSKSIKALGTRHSFNSIADSSDTQISLEHFQQFGHLVIDEKARTVTVGAGVRYGQMAPELQKRGFALHNLASLPHISVAGARSTATHGSGNKNGNLATAVSGFEFVSAKGDLASLSRARDGDRFLGAVVDLGALGIVTRVTLDIQPTFDVAQTVYENLPLTALENHLDEIFGAGYSVSLFTDWQNHRATQVWIKRRVGPGSDPSPLGPEFFGARAATVNLHPLAGHSAENCTEQLGVPGPWYERLPHFRMDFTPSSGAELQTEYFVPRDKAYQAILAVERLRDRITPHLFITEFRTIDADGLWMSPCYRRPSLAIHFTWKPEWPEVKKVLPAIEAELAPFDAKPHWAKLFTMTPARLQGLYPKLKDYKQLMASYDPGSKFRNEFLASHLYA